MVTERIRLGGLQPIEGDLVMADGAVDAGVVVSPSSSSSSSSSSSAASAASAAAAAPASSLPAANDENVVVHPSDEKKVGNIQIHTLISHLDFLLKKLFNLCLFLFFPQAKVRILTANDLSRFTIHDVVLPLPGYAVIYPRNSSE